VEDGKDAFEPKLTIVNLILHMLPGLEGWSVRTINVKQALESTGAMGTTMKTHQDKVDGALRSIERKRLKDASSRPDSEGAGLAEQIPMSWTRCIQTASMQLRYMPTTTLSRARVTAR
jgi:hypothetical protein